MRFSSFVYCQPLSHWVRLSGLASLLNDYSLKTSGKPLGFLNPLFYQAQADDPSTFHDITVRYSTIFVFDRCRCQF